MTLPFFLVLLFVSFSSWGNVCIPSSEDCTFYQCREQVRSCGFFGYYEGYGYKYCSKFTRESDRLSPMGQTWLIQTRTCLQEKLAALDESSNCVFAQSYALGSHKYCYFEVGKDESSYCDLSFEDKKVVESIISDVPGNLSALWLNQIIYCDPQSKFNVKNRNDGDAIEQPFAPTSFPSNP